MNWESNGTARQAILFDIAHEKLYLFGLVLWPQDALLLAFVLIIAATALFLVTALAGRLFCGFACPQTVYTTIFTWIEAKVEGDHLARLKLDQSTMNWRKLRIKLMKHGIWGVVSVWTAITFVGYFHAHPRIAAVHRGLPDRSLGSILADLLCGLYLRAGGTGSGGGMSAHVPVFAFPGCHVRPGDK